jgi:hypothetical protein
MTFWLLIATYRLIAYGWMFHRRWSYPPLMAQKKNPSTVGFNSSLSAIFHGVPGTLGFNHASKASLGEAAIVLA